MSKDILTTLNFVGGAKLSGLPQASGNGEAVVYEQLNAAIEGLSWKDEVVAASTANINLSAPGSSIDGVTMVNGDRFLAKNQTDAGENGVYIWNSAVAPAVRSADMNETAEFYSAVVPVRVGGTANGGTTWRVSAVVPGTAYTFTSFVASSPAASESTPGILEIATQGEVDTGTDDLRAVTALKLASWAGKAKRYAATIGDGSSTSITVTHNLGTRDCVPQIYKNSGNYDTVDCEVQRTSINALALLFNAAPGSNALRCVVLA